MHKIASKKPDRYKEISTPISPLYFQDRLDRRLFIVQWTAQCIMVCLFIIACEARPFTAHRGRIQRSISHMRMLYKAKTPALKSGRATLTIILLKISDEREEE